MSGEETNDRRGIASYSVLLDVKKNSATHDQSLGTNGINHITNSNVSILVDHF